jgi:hypothetical protein
VAKIILREASYFVFFTEYYSSDYILESNAAGTYCTHGRKGKCFLKMQWYDLKKWGQLGQYVDPKIILKWILN